MDENELRRKMQAGELAANNGTVMRTLAIAGCDFKFLKLKGLLLALAFFGFRCLVTVPASTTWRTADTCRYAASRTKPRPAFRTQSWRILRSS